MRASDLLAAVLPVLLEGLSSQMTFAAEQAAEVIAPLAENEKGARDRAPTPQSEKPADGAIILRKPLPQRHERDDEGMKSVREKEERSNPVQDGTQGRGNGVSGGSSGGKREERRSFE